MHRVLTDFDLGGIEAESLDSRKAIGVAIEGAEVGGLEAEGGRTGGFGAWGGG